jgi:hypothetical protein
MGVIGGRGPDLVERCRIDNPLALAAPEHPLGGVPRAEGDLELEIDGEDILIPGSRRVQR